MSLEDIKKKILEDAKKEADEIIEAAKKQADEIIEKAKKEIENLKLSYEKKAKEEYEETIRRGKITADLEVKKMLLAKKRELINRVYEEALTVLKKMNAKKYAKNMEMLLKQAVEKGDEVVIVSENERVINEDFIAKINEKYNFNLKLSDQKGSFIGGFILSQGDIDVNCSFEMLLEAAKDELEPKVVSKLFAS